MAQRFLLAIKYDGACKRLEVAIESWAQWVRVIHGNDASSYKVTKRISSTEKWECGIFHLRKPWKLPKEELNGLVAKDFSEKRFRQSWIELIVLIKPSASANEVNQQRIILETFLKSIVFPVSRTLSPPSEEIQNQLWEIISRIPKGLKIKVWVDERGELIPIESVASTKLPARRGRERLSDQELKERADLVCEAMRKKTFGKKWEAIAKDIGIPERTLRYYRHDTRITKLLEGRDCSPP